MPPYVCIVCMELKKKLLSIFLLVYCIIYLQTTCARSIHVWKPNKKTHNMWYELHILLHAYLYLHMNHVIFNCSFHKTHKQHLFCMIFRCGTFACVQHFKYIALGTDVLLYNSLPFIRLLLLSGQISDALNKVVVFYWIAPLRKAHFFITEGVVL